MNKVVIYFKSILFPVVIGAIIGIVIAPFMEYQTFQKPFIAPPSILFPIIWTILYVLMGISYGILKSKKLTDQKINKIYYLQLFINSLWSIFFFVFKWRLFSFLWILLLIISVLIMIQRFSEKNKVAGLLQIPYLIWIVFASYLNLAIYFLN